VNVPPGAALVGEAVIVPLVTGPPPVPVRSVGVFWQAPPAVGHSVQVMRWTVVPVLTGAKVTCTVQSVVLPRQV